MYWKSINLFMVMTQTCVRYCVHCTLHHNWLLVQSQHFLFPSYGTWLSVYISATDTDIIQMHFKLLIKSLNEQSELLLPRHIMTCNYNCYICYLSWCIVRHVPHFKKTWILTENFLFHTMWEIWYQNENSCNVM